MVLLLLDSNQVIVGGLILKCSKVHVARVRASGLGEFENKLHVQVYKLSMQKNPPRPGSFLRL